MELGARALTAWLGTGPAHQTFLAASGDLVLRLAPTSGAERPDVELAAADLHEALAAGGPAIPAPRYPPEVGDEVCLVVRDPLGRPLRQRSGALPQPLALALGAALLDALARLHDRGDFHGALTPSRILGAPAGDGLVLADTGLAAVAQDLAHTPIRTTTPGFSEFWGEAALVPPEIIRGEELSPASDVFLVAALVWRWLTGRDAYRAQQVLGLYQRIGRGERPSMVTLDLGLPLALARGLDAALSPDPDERPQPAELRALLAQQPSVTLEPAFEPAARAWSAGAARRAPEDAPGPPESPAEIDRQARLRRAAIAFEIGAGRAATPTTGRRALIGLAAIVLGAALVWGLHLLSR
ncbi:MAG: hypothetical protein R3F39_04045 [Myxococcota bacterium]